MQLHTGKSFAPERVQTAQSMGQEQREEPEKNSTYYS